MDFKNSRENTANIIYKYKLSIRNNIYFFNFEENNRFSKIAYATAANKITTYFKNRRNYEMQSVFQSKLYNIFRNKDF